MNENDYFKKGKELLDSGNIELAVKYLDRAYANDPDNEKLLNMLGLVYFKSGRLENAYQIYRKLINKNPDNPTLRLNMGVLLYKKKEYSIALEELTIAEKLEPNNTKISDYKGMCLEQEKEYEKALAEYEKSGNTKFIERAKEKLRTKKTKFKVKGQESTASKNGLSTEDILLKHYGTKTSLNTIEDENDIDNVLKEFDGNKDENQDNGLFDSTKLTELVEESENSQEPEEANPGSQEISIEKELSVFEDNKENESYDIHSETSEMVKQLYNYEETSKTTDSFDEKVEDFFKTHRKIEDEIYKKNLEDINDDDIALDDVIPGDKSHTIQEQTFPVEEQAGLNKNPQEEEEEEENHESPVALHEAEAEIDRDMGHIFPEPEEETEEHNVPHGTEIQIKSIATLEALTRELIIKDQQNDPVVQIEKNIIIYSFTESFICNRNSLLGYSGNIRELDNSPNYQKFYKYLKNKFNWINGEGKLILKLRDRIFIPIKLFGDVFTVNCHSILGVDINLIKDLIIDEAFSLAKLEGKGYLLLSVGKEIISLSIEDGHDFQCRMSAFLGFMGINTPSVNKNDHHFISNLSNVPSVMVNGPGIVFLFKGLF